MHKSLRGLPPAPRALHLVSRYSANAADPLPGWMLQDSKEATAMRARVLAICSQGLNGPDRLPNRSKKKEGFALHLFGGAWRSNGHIDPPRRDDFRLRVEPWLQMARTLVCMAVAEGGEQKVPRLQAAGCGLQRLQGCRLQGDGEVVGCKGLSVG